MSSSPSRAGASSPSPPRLPRSVVTVHALTLVSAFAVWAYLDRNLWFFGDEWDFLTRRGLDGAYFSIWAPHNEHWSVLPILLWRAIYSLEHLSTYWAYLIPLLLVHVAVVHLIWRRCLREGADVWLATAVALLFALLGTGAENLTWAFQIGFVSSLLFGFLAMEAAEGPMRARAPRLTGPWGRDMTAAALALAALRCSTVGLATALALGVVVLSRSGWRRTVRTLAVPLGAFVLWFALAGHTGLKDTGDTVDASVFAKAPEFVATNLSQALGHIAGRGALGGPLALVVAAWLLWCSVSLFRRHPAALGGAAGAVLFYLLAAVGRDRISATESPSRYAYVGAALLMPALALFISAAVSALARSPAGPPQASARGAAAAVARVVLVLLVVAATAGNVVSGARFARSRTIYVRGLENEIVTTGALLQSHTQLARAINTYPIWASGFAAGYLTPGLLADLYRERLLPRARPGLMTTGELLNDESWLDLTGKGGPLFKGRFQLLGVVGLSVSRISGLRGPHRSVPGDWPTGPGNCVFVTSAGRYLARSFPSSVRFGPAGAAVPATFWVSLGAPGGLVLVYLARPWGLEGLPGGTALEGPQVRVPSGGHVWLSDSVPGEDLVLQLPARSSAELCGLSMAVSPTLRGAQPHHREAATIT